MKTNLTLQCISGNFYSFKKRQKNKKIMQSANKIIKKQKNRCIFCKHHDADFSSHDIISLNGDYTDHSKRNLAVACDMCKRCVLLDQYITLDETHDKLIYLPEISQVKLNIITNAMMSSASSKSNPTELISKKTIYSTLVERADLLTSFFDYDVTHPRNFMYLVECSNKNKELVSGIKLLRALRQ